MSEYSSAPEQSDLSEELESFVQYQRASTGQRFLNWLIDVLLMQYGLVYLTGTIVGLLLAALFPSYVNKIYYDKSTWDVILISYVVGIFNYLIYYPICEKAFRGYTLGKLITGTRAIRTDGTELTFKDALLRTLCRLVPFEILTGFGTPWHDLWTNTTVIKSR
jgi:uncharacterized RDD family membrane protein YckC